MEVPNFRLEAEENEKILFVLNHLRNRLDVSSVFLINRNGQAIAYNGKENGLDVQALASLSASNLAATFGLASLIGEGEFERIYHQGENQSILINPVGALALLVVIFEVAVGKRIDLKSLRQSSLILEDVLSRCAKS